MADREQTFPAYCPQCSAKGRTLIDDGCGTIRFLSHARYECGKVISEYHISDCPKAASYREGIR